MEEERGSQQTLPWLGAKSWGGKSPVQQVGLEPGRAGCGLCLGSGLGPGGMVAGSLGACFGPRDLGDDQRIWKGHGRPGRRAVPLGLRRDLVTIFSKAAALKGLRPTWPTPQGMNSGRCPEPPAGSRGITKKCVNE